MTAVKYLWCALGGMLLFTSVCFVMVAQNCTSETRFAYSRSFAIPVDKTEAMSAGDPTLGDDPIPTILLPHLKHEMPYYALFGAVFGICVGVATKHGHRLTALRQSLRQARAGGPAQPLD